MVSKRKWYHNGLTAFAVLQTLLQLAQLAVLALQIAAGRIEALARLSQIPALNMNTLGLVQKQRRRTNLSNSLLCRHQIGSRSAQLLGDGRLRLDLALQ